MPDPRIRAAAESLPLLDIGGDIVVQLKERWRDLEGFYDARRCCDRRESTVLWTIQPEHHRWSFEYREILEAVGQQHQILGHRLSAWWHLILTSRPGKLKFKSLNLDSASPGRLYVKIEQNAIILATEFLDAGTNVGDGQELPFDSHECIIFRSGTPIVATP